jgi:hypothetical protein
MLVYCLKETSTLTHYSADDEVVIQDSEDKLQISVYTLNQMRKDYNLKRSTDKTKIMAFKGNT